jgi:VCBS repeat-containing protein
VAKKEILINGKTYYELGGDPSVRAQGEPHGVIRFKGAFTSLTWENPVSENWHGFTVGTKTATQDLQNVKGEFLNGTTNALITTTPTTLISYDPTLTTLVGTLDTTVSTARVNETNAGLSATGSLSQYDADTTNLLTPQVDSVAITGVTTGLSLSNAEAKALLSVSSTDTSSLQASRLNWSFNSGSTTFDYLAAGEELTFTYTVSTRDGTGRSGTDGTQGSTTSTVTVTIVGTNDGPTLTAGVVSGAITEDDGTYSRSGSVSFTDLDLANRHTAAILTSNSDAAVWSGGTLTASQKTALLAGWQVTAAGSNTNNGTYNWNYTVSNSNLQFLRDGETVVLKGYLEVTDPTGSKASQLLTITLTGTNDTPVISNAPDVASLAETNASLTSSDTIRVTDTDDTDTVAASILSMVISGGTYTTRSGYNRTTNIPLSDSDLLGMLALSATGGTSALTANTPSGSDFTWTFTSGPSSGGGNKAFEFLAAGESLELTYTVKVQDNSPDRTGQGHHHWHQR